MTAPQRRPRQVRIIGGVVVSDEELARENRGPSVPMPHRPRKGKGKPTS